MFLLLSFWTNDVTNFPTVMKLMSSLTCYLRFSIFVLETLTFEWQCSQYLDLIPNCALCTAIDTPRLSSKKIFYDYVWLCIYSVWFVVMEVIKKMLLPLLLPGMYLLLDRQLMARCQDFLTCLQASSHGS